MFRAADRETTVSRDVLTFAGLAVPLRNYCGGRSCERLGVNGCSSKKCSKVQVRSTPKEQSKNGICTKHASKTSAGLCDHIPEFS